MGVEEASCSWVMKVVFSTTSTTRRSNEILSVFEFPLFSRHIFFRSLGVNRNCLNCTPNMTVRAATTAAA
jgi:hypothetical protein